MVRRLCSTLSSPRRFGSGRARTTVSTSRQYSSITLCVHSAFRSLKHGTLKHQNTGAAEGDFVEGHVNRVCGSISRAYVQLLWRSFRLFLPRWLLCTALRCSALFSLPGLPDCRLVTMFPPTLYTTPSAAFAK